MNRATIGTCNGCGLGVNLPHREPWAPGMRVVVLTEQAYERLVQSQRFLHQIEPLRPWKPQAPNPGTY